MSMSKSNIDILGRLPLAALAMACGSALGAQINPDLAAAVHRDGSAQALIVLSDQSTPMLAPFAATADYKQHRRALVEALQGRAETQQASVRALLESRGIAYRSYWIANVVLANVDSRTLALIAARHEVSRIEPNPILPSHLPRPNTTGNAPAEVDSIAWGVTKINAPEVWAAGDHGPNIVIAGEGKGYQWDHPALKPL